MNESNGKAQKTRTTFKLTCSVSNKINATPEKIWKLLTDADNYTKWNSTLTSLEGEIALGGLVKMKVPEAPGRVFKVKVVEFKSNRSMLWQDGFAPMFMGRRYFTLTPGNDGSTVFSMSEVFTGLMLPMIAGKLPDFVPIFEKYADDLKKEAEKAG
ncbi:MAG: SRPBCC family protein [Flavobacteriales bacterium]